MPVKALHHLDLAVADVERSLQSTSACWARWA